MIKASDMLTLAKNNATEIINRIFEDSDFKEHSLYRIQQEAKEGKMVYDFYFREELLIELRDMLLTKIKPIIKEFEDNGFKVLVRDNGNGYWSDICVKFYWGDNKKEWLRMLGKNDKYLGDFENIYTTEW